MTTPLSPLEPTAAYPILVVDDEFQIYDLIQQVAKTEFPQAQFTYQASYHTAINYLVQLRGELPRLVILDIDLSGSESGLEILNWLRAHTHYALVPVVILSVIHDEAVVRDAYARGANMFTNKPYNLDEWRHYVHFLRNYWFELATTPSLWLEQTTSTDPVGPTSSADQP